MPWTTTVNTITSEFLNLVATIRFVNPDLKVDITSEKIRFAEERQLANYILQTRLLLERFAAFKADISSRLAQTASVYDADARLQDMQDIIDAANAEKAANAPVPSAEEIAAGEAQQAYQQARQASLTLRRKLDEDISIGLVTAEDAKAQMDELVTDLQAKEADMNATKISAQPVKVGG